MAKKNNTRVRRKKKIQKGRAVRIKDLSRKVDHLNKVVSQCFQFHQNRLTSPYGGH